VTGNFGVAFYMPKTAVNVGTLFRTGHAFGSSFNSTIGHRRYQRQASDTTNVKKNMPFYEFDTFEKFYSIMPHGFVLVGVEIDESAISLPKFKHPRNAIYLLGAEDNGLPRKVLNQCHIIIKIPSKYCLNVAVAGSIVIYDRIRKEMEQ
jgi:tRNA (guanosine-2'-O-)-methyltransferase